MFIPKFPDKLKAHFDEFAWRIGRLTNGTRAAFVDKYLLVFHQRAPDGYDRYCRQKLRFGIFLTVSQEAVLVVYGKHGTDVMEWGPEEEILEALQTLRRLTVLDDLASV